MDKFLLKRKSASTSAEDEVQSSRVNVNDLEADPGLRIQISRYHPNDQDIVRRHYLLLGPCQPRDHSFPQSDFSGMSRRFNPLWFNKYSSWLEYSVNKDAAFCLYCYLFPEIGGKDAFVSTGFRNWKKYEKIHAHVGGVNSSHNKAFLMGQNLLKQEQHIQTIFHRSEAQSDLDYEVRLQASVDCIQFLLNQGMPFRGRDESEGSNNQEIFLKF